MKVLERKKPTAIVKCPHCGSKLEIDSSDIFWYKEIDGGNAPCVICAVCQYSRAILYSNSRLLLSAVIGIGCR